jgi:hypothetical protein
MKEATGQTSTGLLVLAILPLIAGILSWCSSAATRASTSSPSRGDVWDFWVGKATKRATNNS